MVVYYHLFFIEMKDLSIVIEILEKIALLYCFITCIHAQENKNRLCGAAVFLTCVLIALKILLSSDYVTNYLLELFAMAIFIFISFRNKKLLYFTLLFNLYTIFGLVRLLVGILTFPIVILTKIDGNGIASEILIGIFCVISYFSLMYFCQERKAYVEKEMPLVTRVGITSLLGFCEWILLVIRYMGFDGDYIVFYNILLFAIIFSVIIVFLWLFDKAQEQKRLQEMTAYAHRTREVIPSLSRVLEKLEDASAYQDQADEIIRELRMICNSDMERNKMEAAVIKSFETTGCFALDEQLERYLDEAATQGFHLDVMVRASIKEILNEQKIEIYSLLQVVGDLYRNAYTAISKTEKQGRILLCFGYNQRGHYEISVHDNGVLFPQHVLEHLGERGVTTGGTGHGMADIFEVLERNQISYLLNQDLSIGSIFTKSISLVFDGQGEKRIECR